MLVQVRPRHQPQSWPLSSTVHPSESQQTSRRESSASQHYASALDARSPSSDSQLPSPVPSAEPAAKEQKGKDREQSAGKANAANKADTAASPPERPGLSTSLPQSAVPLDRVDKSRSKPVNADATAPEVEEQWQEVKTRKHKKGGKHSAKDANAKTTEESTQDLDFQFDEELSGEMIAQKGATPKTKDHRPGKPARSGAGGAHGDFGTRYALIKLLSIVFSLLQKKPHLRRPFFIILSVWLAFTPIVL